MNNFRKLVLCRSAIVPCVKSPVSECQRLGSSFSERRLQSTTAFIPRRAVLYVPADDPKKIAKIENLHVDCPVLECEDGVAVSRKEEARQGVLQALTNAPYVKRRKVENRDVAARINAISSDFAEEDLRTILSGPIRPTTVFIPKTESVDEVEWISEKMQKYLPDRAAGERPLRLIFYAESAKALLDFRKILRKALELADKRNRFQVDGAVFGSDDYSADIGAVRTKEASEVLYARQHFVAVLKSFQRGLQAIDLVHIDYKELDDLKRQAQEGARFGFTGKQIIHPNQADIVQAAFSPSSEKIQWATELVAAFRKHEKEGKGAFTFRNSMIDRPLLLQAQNILALHESFKSQTS